MPWFTSIGQLCKRYIYCFQGMKTCEERNATTEEGHGEVGEQWGSEEVRKWGSEEARKRGRVYEENKEGHDKWLKPLFKKTSGYLQMDIFRLSFGNAWELGWKMSWAMNVKEKPGILSLSNKHRLRRQQLSAKQMETNYNQVTGRVLHRLCHISRII